MRRYTSEELMELAAGYALGATSEEETAAIERALATSPALRSEIASFQDVAVQLAQSRAVTPSPSVRARLMERVRETPDVAPDAGAVPITSAPSLARAAVTSRPARAWGWAIGIAASLLVAALLGIQNYTLRRALDARGGELVAARAEADKRHRQLETVLEAEKDLYVAQMKSADTVTGPGIQFFWNAKQQVAMAHAFRLPPAPAGRAYQLWLIRDGKPVPSTVFNSDPDGHAMIENIAVPPNTVGVTQVLLTEEPAGGSPAPTTKPFVGGVLAKT